MHREALVCFALGTEKGHHVVQSIAEGIIELVGIHLQLALLRQRNAKVRKALQPIRGSCHYTSDQITQLVPDEIGRSVSEQHSSLLGLFIVALGLLEEIDNRIVPFY